MSLLERCKDFTEAKQVMAMGVYPYFTEISSQQDTEVIISGKKVLMLGSNSYLGLTVHPKVKEAAIKAVEKYGTGNAGSRFLNGSLDLHRKLEEKLAEFVNKESAMVFSTGFQSNLGCIPTITRRGDYIILDKADHASIIDAATLSQACVRSYKHNDMEHLERHLKLIRDKFPSAGVLVVVDGVFSMDGDLVNLPEVVRLCEKYDAAIMVDDAHGIGVVGNGGRGTASHFGLDDKVDIIMGTFSKSLASLGGFIAADEEVIHYLKHFARPFIFSASIPPASAAATLAALEVMQEEPELIDRLWENTRHIHEGFKEMGYDTGVSETPIIPLHIGEAMTVFKMRKMLLDEGVFVNPVVPPAVPEGDCLIRVSLMATHTPEQIDFALEKFYKVGKALGVI